MLVITFIVCWHNERGIIIQFYQEKIHFLDWCANTVYSNWHRLLDYLSADNKINRKGNGLSTKISAWSREKKKQERKGNIIYFFPSFEVLNAESVWLSESQSRRKAMVLRYSRETIWDLLKYNKKHGVKLMAELIKKSLEV